MTRSKKKAAKSADAEEPTLLPASPMSHPDSPEADEVQQTSTQSNNETCPACPTTETNNLNALEKERWIRCDACKKWYHWRCVGQGDDLETIDKWFCRECMEEKPTRIITRKIPTRKSSRKRTYRDYANLDSGIGFDSARWPMILEGKSTNGDPFKRMQGSEVGISWVEADEGAMREPIVIERPDGLGLKMPSKDLTVEDVSVLVGEDTAIEVIDVSTQSTSPGWTLKKWAEYVALAPDNREKVLNVISLEISGTKLADMILPPRLVRELGWVENYWPNTRKGKGHAYPKVQLYCLMGVATAWTDWHIDFAGSSVYYHILHGSKVFYFIRPTAANLAAYERWSGTELQYQSWLGDMVDEVYKVELNEGNTMIIPSGWIHAVYTPIDTMVFGGNFLHSYSVPTQLRVRNIEIATQVPRKFRFPMFSKLCWYVGEKYLRDLRVHSEPDFSPRLFASLMALAEFLVSEARILERGTDTAKKEVREQIPVDRVKDAPAMARELRWRLRLAAGMLSDDESSKKPENLSTVLNGTKRHTAGSEGFDDGTLRLKNFKPRLWDRVEEKVEEFEMKKRHPGPTNDGTNWTDAWMENNTMETEEDGPDTEVHCQRTVVVKVRKTGKGVERQRIERVVEEWSWHNAE